MAEAQERPDGAQAIRRAFMILRALATGGETGSLRLHAQRGHAIVQRAFALNAWMDAWVAFNREMPRQWPKIIERGTPPPDADSWLGVDRKFETVFGTAPPGAP